MIISDDDMNQTSEGAGRHRLSSPTPSITLLNQRLGISPAPRMLTRSGIDLLRKCREEVVQVTRKVLASKDETKETSSEDRN